MSPRDCWRLLIRVAFSVNCDTRRTHLGNFLWPLKKKSIKTNLFFFWLYSEMARCLSHWNCSDRRLTASPFTGLTVTDSSRRYPTTAKGPKRPTPQWWITTMWLATKSHVTGFHLRTPDTAIVSFFLNVKSNSLGKCISLDFFELRNELIAVTNTNFLFYFYRQVLCQRWSVCPPWALVGMGWQASS